MPRSTPFLHNGATDGEQPSMAPAKRLDGTDSCGGACDCDSDRFQNTFFAPSSRLSAARMVTQRDISLSHMRVEIEGTMLQVWTRDRRMTVIAAAGHQRSSAPRKRCERSNSDDCRTSENFSRRRPRRSKQIARRATNVSLCLREYRSAGPAPDVVRPSSNASQEPSRCKGALLGAADQ
jgi:hypothetical protein